MAGIMNRKMRTLLRLYEAALHRHLKEGGPASRKTARRLGLRALALGLETLDLAMIHEQALMAWSLPVRSAAVRERIIKNAGVFFAETILPIETTHRSAMETNVQLSRLNKALIQRTQDLSASNRKLKKEIVKRKGVEQTLRQSKNRSIHLLEQSKLLQGQLRRLSRQILSAQEDDRKRISRELHDVVAQMLTGINVRLATLNKDATTHSKGLSQKIAHTQRLVEKSVDAVHRFARELRPAVLDDLGLIPALHSFMKGFMRETGIRVSLTAAAEVEKLSAAKRTALYRTAHEALTNAARHAKASRVEITLQRLPHAVAMDIRDNGRGFDLKRVLNNARFKRLGLLGIRERVEMVGGKFSIESVPGKGTTIHVQVPLNHAAREGVHP